MNFASSRLCGKEKNMIQVLTIVVLSIVVYQDFKFRAISAILLPLLLLLLLAKNGLGADNVINLAFIVLQLTVLTAYISLKNKRLTNIIDSYLGLGDILFLMVACVAFSTMEFVVFYVAGLLFSLLAFMIYRVVRRNTSPEIPLAGLLSIAMIIQLLTPLTINH